MIEAHSITLCLQLGASLTVLDLHSLCDNRSHSCQPGSLVNFVCRKESLRLTFGMPVLPDVKRTYARLLGIVPTPRGSAVAFSSLSQDSLPTTITCSIIYIRLLSRSEDEGGPDLGQNCLYSLDGGAWDRSECRASFQHDEHGNGSPMELLKQTRTRSSCLTP